MFADDSEQTSARMKKAAPKGRSNIVHAAAIFKLRHLPFVFSAARLANLLLLDRSRIMVKWQEAEPRTQRIPQQRTFELRKVSFPKYPPDRTGI